MKCDTKKTCHARVETVIPGHTRATLLICFEPVAAHPVNAADMTTRVHVDRIVGVGFLA